MTKRMILSVAVGLIIIAATIAATIQQRREARIPTGGDPIIFRIADSVQDRAAIGDIVAHARYEFQVRDLLPALARGELRIADIDINRDGTPEYFVLHNGKQYCQNASCAAQLFWFFEGQWHEWLNRGIEESLAWGAKRPGFRDYVVYTGERREIFPFLEGREIAARPLRTDEEKAVALDYIQRSLAIGAERNPEETPGFWQAKIDEGFVKLIEADLDDDGQAEWIIVTEVFAYCGTIGCEALLLRKSGRTWQLMTQLSIAGFFLLDDRKFGWHRIFTGEEIYTFKDGRFFESVIIDDARIARGRYADPPY